MAFRNPEIALACALLVGLSSGAARADDNLEQAKMLFAAGAAAYEKHDYVDAIRAFEGAQKLAPRAAILFSLAQAHRHLYQNTGKAEDLKAAADGYREYVRQVPQGHRHDDAERELKMLDENAQHASDENAANVSINSSGTPGARIVLDDAAPIEPPLIGPVAPGPHRVVIMADGYVTERRSVTAVPGKIIAIDVPLREKMASVTVAAPQGARVSVDGRPMGDAPLATPLELASGVHLLAVTENGHDAFLRDLDLGRGETRRVDASLVTSTQRKIAMGMLVGAAACVVAGGAFLGVTVVEQTQAQSFLDIQKNQKRALTQPEAQSYADDRDQRISWGIATAATFSAGAALALTGVLLYAFDQPSTSGAARRDSAPETKPAPRKTEPSEMGFAPLLGPGVVGAIMEMKF
ncbi:MAG TPA: PEGA domain-containing protein [Polyangiaceae bacterium]|jgi:hypothetical protein